MKLHEPIETIDEYGNKIIVYPVNRKVVYFKSESKPGVKHKVMRARTGKVVCTCEGFLWRETCKHVEKAKSWK